jgi:hypothetical protein
MKNRIQQQGPGNEEQRRDERLGALLAMAYPDSDVLPWQRIVDLVEAAPPVRRIWYDALLGAPLRPLRYASLAVCLIAGTVGTLAALPAQSDQVGTLLLTKLPSAWQADGTIFEEVQQAAQGQFNQLGLPESELYVMVTARDGRDELTFAMLGADTAAAERFYSQFSTDYPALAAFKPEYKTINSGRVGSRLNELLLQLTTSGELNRGDDNALRSAVLKALGDSELQVDAVRIDRQADGRVVINVEASIEISVDGHSREEMEAQGLTEELLGSESYQQLLSELALPHQK